MNKLTTLDVEGRYLEIGAGTGTLATIIAKQNANIDITAIEVSTDMIIVGEEYIKENGVESQVRFVKGDIGSEGLLKSLGKFDLIYSTFSLHHWEDSKEMIENLMQYLNDDGVLLISDLKRVWWLHWVPVQNGLFKSIRAAYRPREIREMLDTIGVRKYEIENVFPFFMQNITIWR